MGRSSSWSIGRIFQCEETKPPPVERRIADRIATMQDGSRRRVSDTIETAFHQACLTNDLETAVELLAILERMERQSPEAAGMGGNRRQPIATAALRKELDEARQTLGSIRGHQMPARRPESEATV